MRSLVSTSRRRVARVLGACVLLTGGVGASVLFAAGPAGATSCNVGTPCTITGTATLTGGTLSLTTPSSLAWSGTLTGIDTQIVDTATTDQTYTVNDATGSGAGWHVTVDATTFTTGGATPLNLADSGTFSTTGSVTSATATTAPTDACTSGSTCTLPTNSTTYPVAITTAATTPTAVTVYDTAASTGIGSVDIGGSAAANPVGWWLNLPATTQAGTYTSTVDLNVVSGP